jgi:hypothetical protein
MKLDKTAFSVTSLSEADDEVAYWLTKSPEERLGAMEQIRQVIYGNSPTTARLQRVFTVVRLGADPE